MERRSYWSSIISQRVGRRRALAITGGFAAGAALLAAYGGGDGHGEDVSGLITKPQDTSKEAKRGSVLLATRNQDVFTFDGQSSLIGGIGAGTIYSRLFKLAPGVMEPPSLDSLLAATPLFYYVLKEAEIMESGLHLGPVGGRIVGEVFVNCLRNDPNSYLVADPHCVPTLTNSGAAFRMKDFLMFAGVDPASRGQ